MKDRCIRLQQIVFLHAIPSYLMEMQGRITCAFSGIEHPEYDILEPTWQEFYFKMEAHCVSKGAMNAHKE